MTASASEAGAVKTKLATDHVGVAVATRVQDVRARLEETWIRTSRGASARRATRIS